MGFNDMDRAGKLILIGMAALVILIVIFFVIAFFTKKPVDISATVGCLGGNTCFVGQILKINLGFNHNYGPLTEQNKSIRINSDAIESQENPLVVPIQDRREFSVPLRTTLKEGNYMVGFTTDVVSAGNIFQRLILWGKHLLIDEYKATKEIFVRYPIIKIEVDSGDYSCDKNGFQQIKEITLKLEEQLIDVMTCKIRIKTNKLVTTNHPLLKEGSISPSYHYYENNWSTVNKLDLTGSVQNLVLNADPAVQQITTTLTPICLIDEREVSIEKYSMELKKCPVNQ